MLSLTRRVAFALALCLLPGCVGGPVYHAKSSNPALVQAPIVFHGPNVLGIGVGDSLSLIAVDGQNMGMPLTDRDFRHIDPGLRRLSLIYEGNKQLLGPKFTSIPLVLNAQLEGGHRYRVICESTDVSVKAFVRDLATNKTVSNVAEAPLLVQPQPTTVPIPIVIPSH